MSSPLSKTENRPTLRPQWDRGNLAEWRESQSPERRREDQAKLSRIFNLAAKVPELKDALDWAKAHDIEFAVDRKASAGGYYTVGTGVVAVVNDTFDFDNIAAGVLVHEIRHAWQDYYGMIPTTGKNLPAYFTRRAVVEADATAHQLLALHQYSLSLRIDAEREKNGKGSAQRIARLQSQLADRHADPEKLWHGFQSWYRTKASYYWNHCVKFLGSRLGVPGIPRPDVGAEYQPYEGRKEPLLEGLDTTREEQLRRLGKGFLGGNYLNKAAPDAFPSEYLSPSRAEVCYRKHPVGEFPKPSKRVKEIRRRQLLLKHHRGFEALL